MSGKAKPVGHTSPRVDAIAGKLMHSSGKPAVREIAAAAVSDTRPSAHTSAGLASLAGSLLNTGTKQERIIAASVLADHKTRKGK